MGTKYLVFMYSIVTIIIMALAMSTMALTTFIPYMATAKKLQTSPN